MTRRAARTATTKVVTDINRTAVLDTLEQRGPLTRTALRERTGLSPATIDRLCTALLDEGLIEQSGVTASRGGRPAALWRFAGARRVIVAAAVTAAGPRGMLVGVDGTIVERLAGGDAGDQLDRALDLIGELLGRATATGRSALGVALSVPGVVDAEGRVSNSEELRWRRLAVGPVAEHRFRLPCLVENDANAIAVGEWTRGAGIGTDSLVAVVLGTGVGAGLVSGGQLVRGARCGAGEIGYLLTGRDALGRLFTRRGDLEAHIAGDRPADEVLDHLALAIAALASVFDPEMVILSGRVPERAVPALEQRLTGRIPFVPQITAGRLGADAALLGVAELLARRTKGSVYLA